MISSTSPDPPPSPTFELDFALRLTQLPALELRGESGGSSGRGRAKHLPRKLTARTWLREATVESAGGLIARTAFHVVPTSAQAQSALSKVCGSSRSRVDVERHEGHETNGQREKTRSRDDDDDDEQSCPLHEGAGKHAIENRSCRPASVVDVSAPPDRECFLLLRSTIGSPPTVRLTLCPCSSSGS